MHFFILKFNKHKMKTFLTLNIIRNFNQCKAQLLQQFHSLLILINKQKLDSYIKQQDIQGLFAKFYTKNKCLLQVAIKGYTFLNKIKLGIIPYSIKSQQIMNQKTFEAQQFAFRYYNKLLKAKPAINNRSPYKSPIKYSSRNISHMAQYQQQLKSKKLVQKLTEIHTKKANPHVRKQKLTRASSTCKSSKQKQYKKKSLINPFYAQQKSLNIHRQNLGLVDRLSSTKSDYNESFSRKRTQKLKQYRKLLKKNKEQLQIQNQLFTFYQQACQKIKKRPQSSKKRCSRINSIKSARPSSAAY